MKYPNSGRVHPVFFSLLLTGIFIFSGNANSRELTGESQLFSVGHPRRLEELPAGRFRTRLEGLSPQARDRALKWLKGMSFPQEDVEYLRASKDGDIWYADTFQPDAADIATLAGPIVSTAIPAAEIFKLHSRPGAPNVLFLDFDGHTITGTAWNSAETTLQALPFDPSGNDSPATVANFTADELNRIGEIWHRISEDYAPFNIDVTTEEPVVFTRRTGRVLFTHDTDANNKVMPAQGAGGVAYVNVFNLSNYHTYYSPALVYYTNLYTNLFGYPTLNSEAGSHEFGHNIAMSHDGVSGGATYYAGHGSPNVNWAPIMGNSYTENVTQWSKGEYPGANNTEDDLALIAADLGYLPDDLGDSAAAATALVVEPDGAIIVSDPELDPHNVLPFNKGIIGDRTDVDWFYVDVGAGALNITAIPAWHAFPRSSDRGANLDIDMALYDSGLTQIVSDDPSNDTYATVSANVPAGRYYLRIDGVGNSTFSNYTDYASIGMYFIEGSVVPSTSDTTAPLPDPMSWAIVPVATGSSSITMTATSATDDSGIVLYEFVCLAGGSGCTSSGWQSATQYDATGLAPGAQYTYVVRAKDNSDNTTGNSAQQSATTNPVPNQSPTAAFSPSCTNLSCSFTDQSSDSDGSIAAWAWNFGDGGTATAQNPGHNYAAAGTYTVALTVTDNQGGTNATSQSVTVSDVGGGSLEVFFDSFENGAWNGLWTEDAQNDWFTSTQRAMAGNRSAEVDGSATDAQLNSAPINLQGRSQATITFNWLIESGLDTGEYLAFDVSTNGGSSWVEKARLRGNVDAENSWRPVQVDLSGLSSLRLRFRGRMSSSTEDANVDAVRVVAGSGGGTPNINPAAAFSPSCTNLSCSFTDQSSDSDGSIAAWAWNFGDGGTATAQNPGHNYAAAGTYTVALTVTDNQGGTNATSQSVTVSDVGGGSLEVFFDSFENGAWNGLWTEDAQNDWFTSTQRAMAGNRSAEVDGSATNAQLNSVPINLQGRSQATITFNWLIESGLDTGEYLAFDVSTNGGSSWVEKARLRGNVDAENSWRPVQVDLSGLSSLRLRFRGRMSSSTEDANVDAVRVTAQ